MSAAIYFKARHEWELADRARRSCLSVLVLAPLIGLVLERLIFRHLRTAVGGGQAGRDHRAHRRPAEPLRPRRQLRGRRRARPRRASCPTGPRCSTTPSASTPSAATSWWRWPSPWSPRLGLGRAVPVHRHRPADAGRGGEPADDRAQRHPGRPRLGLRLGAVVLLRRPRRRPHRPPVQHPGRARLLQPRGRGRRRRRHRPAGRACPGRWSAGSGSASPSRIVDTFLPRVGRRP